MRPPSVLINLPMFADHHVVHAKLAQLAIHVFDKEFAQKCAFPVQLLGFQPHRHDTKYSGNHVKASVDFVSHVTICVPLRITRNVHYLMPKRAHLFSRVRLRSEKFRKKCHVKRAPLRLRSAAIQFAMPKGGNT